MDAYLRSLSRNRIDTLGWLIALSYWLLPLNWFNFWNLYLDNFFWSITLPLASIRWFQMTSSSLCLLFKAGPSINLCNIELLWDDQKFFGNTENWTWGRWVWSENAIHCAIRPPNICCLFDVVFATLEKWACSLVVRHEEKCCENATPIRYWLNANLKEYKMTSGEGLDE